MFFKLLYLSSNEKIQNPFRLLPPRSIVSQISWKLSFGLVKVVESMIISTTIYDFLCCCSYFSSWLLLMLRKYLKRKVWKYSILRVSSYKNWSNKFKNSYIFGNNDEKIRVFNAYIKYYYSSIYAYNLIAVKEQNSV